MKKRKIATILLSLLVFVALGMVPFMLTGCSDDYPADPMVTAGFAHTTVLRQDGTVWGWGRNEEGQLGNGNRINQYSPVRFRIEPFRHNNIDYLPPEYITQIASHKIHTMALGNDGSVWAGGWNQEGQLGAPVGCRTIPIRVPFPDDSIDPALTRIIDIDAGMLFSIALRDNGNVYGWGRNRNQIMMNAVNATPASQRINTLSRATRFESPELHSIVQIAAGHEHVLALRNDGAVIAWGRNRNGQVANIRNPIDAAPSPTLGPPGGLVWDILLPTVITNDNFPSDPTDRVVKVRGGGFHSLALTEQGHIYAWGRSDRGQIGDGVSHTQGNAQPIPQRVILPEGTRAVYVAGSSADSNAAILDNGRVIVWGRNQEGQLGVGAAGHIREDAFESVPRLALRTVGMYLENIVSIGVGETHMTAICGRHGDVFSWGTNWDGELGNGRNAIAWSNEPLQVMSGVRGASRGGSPPHVEDTVALRGINSLAGGHLFTLALDEDGIVHGWGRNNHGQLLMMHSNDHYVATRLEDFRVHDPRFPIIRNTWINNMGQVAPNPNQGIQGDPNFAVLDNVSAIAAGMEVGFSFGLAVRGGYAYGWGDNEDGWLGHGYVQNRRRTLGEEPKDNNPRPMQFNPAGGGGRVSATAVAAGGRHSLVLRPNGEVYAAGNGGHGRLGNLERNAQGNPTGTNYPLRVVFPNPVPTITQIEAGFQNSFAIDSQGYLWAWGRNHQGQLGTGSVNAEGNPVDSHTPVRILGPSIRLNAGEIVVEVSARNYHTLALTNTGRVFSWGVGWNGRLGHGDGNQRLVPTHIEFGALNIADNRVISIAAGGTHSLAVRYDGTVWSWGNNSSGQLGRPVNSSNVPGQVVGAIHGTITNATQVEAGNEHSLAIVGVGVTSEVFAWGTNSAGALGSGGNQNPPSREAIQQGIASPDDTVLTANRQLSAVQALGVSGVGGFFNIHRSDFPPVNIVNAPLAGWAIFLIILAVLLPFAALGVFLFFYLRNQPKKAYAGQSSYSPKISKNNPSQTKPPQRTETRTQTKEPPKTTPRNSPAPPPPRSGKK